MFRVIVLVVLNVVFAVALAASALPAAVIVAPVTRTVPALGYLLFLVLTAGFVVMNSLLWRLWRRALTQADRN